MRTSNPALNDASFSGFPAVAGDSAMTLSGTVNKTFLLLAMAVMTAGWTWHRAMQPGGMAAVGGWAMAGLLGALVAAMVTVFKKPWAPVTAPVYALLEGIALGAVSAAYEIRFSGIVLQAVMLTVSIAFGLLFLYK